MFVWKRPKINEKEAGDGPFLKKLGSCHTFIWDPQMKMNEIINQITKNDFFCFNGDKLCSYSMSVA